MQSESYWGWETNCIGSYGLFLGRELFSELERGRCYRVPGIRMASFGLHFARITLGTIRNFIREVNDYFCNFRYITANTDTEEPSFPVSKALNTHVEELSLDVLLQKVDHLRMNESDKQESFELLCDHKEKVRDTLRHINITL